MIGERQRALAPLYPSQLHPSRPLPRRAQGPTSAAWELSCVPNGEAPNAWRRSGSSAWTTTTRNSQRDSHPRRYRGRSHSLHGRV